MDDPAMVERPSVFLGSSTEGVAVAEAIQQALDAVAEVTLWTQGVFALTQGFLESLIDTLDRVDFAVIVFAPDDFTISRKKKSPAPRDNTLFELGLFMGHLGRERCAFVFDRTAEIKLPSDLLGIAAATYRPHSSGNLQAALGPACTEIKSRISSMGGILNC